MSFLKSLFLVTSLMLSGFALAASSVDINSADAKTLQTLEGVGPSKAQAIVEYRQANGPFKSVQDLAKVKGIGDKTLDANRDRISVGGATGEVVKNKPTAKN
jgi:competence protein ComEA